MEYQGIIFDFNGTLFFDNDKHVKAWNEISKILRGKEITLEELHTKLNGTPNIQNILYFTDGKATKEELEKSYKKIDNMIEKYKVENFESTMKENKQKNKPEKQVEIKQKQVQEEKSSKEQEQDCEERE